MVAQTAPGHSAAAVADPDRLALPAPLRYAIVGALAATVVVLALAFGYDPRAVRSVVVGRPAPAFDLQHLTDPSRVALADHAGKVVVVNFFASWCTPCKQEYPALLRGWERYRTADVVFIGILHQDRPEFGRAFVRRMGTPWTTTMDDRGRTALAYGVFGIPETFFIGPDGIVHARHIGPISEERLLAGIEALRPAVRSP
jgi:cytochrome c biogenesis protein CcmG, thiol:disulfide interchange protein DsbE